MKSKHSRKKNSRKSVIIIAVIAAAAVFAAVICGIIFFMPDKTDESNNETITSTGTVVSTTVVSSVETATSQSSEDFNVNSNPTQDTTSEQPESSQQIALPVESNAELSYFNASFSPYKAIDTETDEKVSMRLVFGSVYSGGSVVFNDNGSFEDKLINSEHNTGAYAVDRENKKITATYSNDKNMNITVLSWNDEIPAEIIINYGGFDVYLK